MLRISRALCLESAGQDKIWTPRKKKKKKGMSLVESLQQIQLRVKDIICELLNHIRGPSSFQDLKTVCGIETSTFREAALSHELLEIDNSLEKCLEKALSYKMP